MRKGHWLQARGNPIGRANNNPIINSHVYRIEFDDGNVSELTANVITESMYASCDIKGNKYLMMDLFANHRSNAVSKEEQ